MKQNHFSLRRIILIILLCLVSNSIMAQKVNLDTLNIDQPNLDKHKAVDMRKAVAMRKAGMILTVGGVGIVAAGYITSAIWLGTNSLEGWDVFKTLIPFYLGALVGIPATVVGIPLWAIGNHRINAKAKLALKTFNIVPENSLALGLGITLRF
jgi:hypothetical protein